MTAITTTIEAATTRSDPGDLRALTRQVPQRESRDMAQSEIVRLLYEHWLHSGNMAGKAAGSNEAVFALACEELIAELEENESDCEEFVG